MKVLAYGFPVNSNFGGPSVLHGLACALRELDPACELVVYQRDEPEHHVVSDMAFPVRRYPYQGEMKRLVRDWFRYFIRRRRPENPVERGFWEDFATSDVVANVYAICFCCKLAGKNHRRPFLLSLKMAAREFMLSLLARVSGKRSVKTTSSYGPVSTWGEKAAAWWAGMFCFGRLAAREEGSRDEMKRALVLRKIPVFPDLANFMGDFRLEAGADGNVGVAVSYMSERQWGSSSGDYVQRMRQLVEYIVRRTGRHVLLIPNQTNCASGRDDIVVARDVLDGVGVDGVEMLDISGLGGLGLKRQIARCEVVVSCRYHSCVAALSSAVPVLTLGWHHKYVELMKLYGQTERLIMSESCDAGVLERAFDGLWDGRAAIKEDLRRACVEVRGRVLKSVAEQFGLKGGTDEGR